jgi:hypothetical protein
MRVARITQPASFTRIAPAARPLRPLDRPAILAHLASALERGEGSLGAHCIHELWMRGEYAQNVEAALERLWRAAARSIPEWLPMRHIHWLPVVYEVAARFAGKRAGRSNIYLVLLDYSDRRGEPYGIYVGMTRHSPARRFEQHKAGIRAAGSVLKRGIEVLTGPTLHLRRIGRQEAARIEVELAAGLGDAGLRVAGGH